MSVVIMTANNRQSEEEEEGNDGMRNQLFDLKVKEKEKAEETGERGGRGQYPAVGRATDRRKGEEKEQFLHHGRRLQQT